MADSNVVEKPLLEKIQDLLERKPGHYDVAFCVGKEKKIVRALKIVLKASSPFLEKEFEEKWELAVVKEGDGIPLPDFEPIAFEQFVKLTSLDTWSLESLKKLNLLPNNILNLLTICRRFEMKKAVENLETLETKFIQSFRKYKETDDFLQLSQTNLKSVLVRNDIGIKELDVFHSAIRWAEFQCKEVKVERTDQHIREVLGDCLFEIRFPIMTNTEFTEATEAKDILTADESLGIYKYIGLAASKKLKVDTKKLVFKTTPRKTTQALGSEPNPNTNTNNSLGRTGHKESSEIPDGQPVSSALHIRELEPPKLIVDSLIAQPVKCNCLGQKSDQSAPDICWVLISPGVSTLSLIRDSQIVKHPPFVCNGGFIIENHFITCEKPTHIFGLGFLGPIEKDAFYDVKVEINGYNGISYRSGMLEKRIFAQRDKIFYFVFDAPVFFEAGNVGYWSNYYRIYYYITGPNTSAVKRRVTEVRGLILEEQDTKFCWRWESNQLAQILYKLI